MSEKIMNYFEACKFGENLVHVGKSILMNTVRCHSHLANDISLMYNFLPQIAEKQSCDKNLSDEIMFTILKLVGEIRRQKGDELRPLSEDLITSIFEDDFIKGLCAKKHLSTRTYVINYFRDKGIYHHIKEMLSDGLVNN